MMKKIILTLVFAVAALTFTFAQQGGGGRGFGTPEENAKRTVERLNETLKLNEQQKEAIYGIALEQSKERQKMFEGSGATGDRQAAFTKMREAQEKTDQKILAVLDAKQKEAYQQIVKERAERQNRGPGTGGGAGRRGGQ